MGNEKRGIYPELKEAAAECCGNCRYFQMAEAQPEAPPMLAGVVRDLGPVTQGQCLRYPPAVFPMGQKNVIAGAELALASVSVRVVVGANDWCGEFAAHGPLLQ